jgi:N-acetylglucosaminyldiphosphoundecaprenol N-acetyl-beta-D-mannosaminyltransferase
LIENEASLTVIGSSKLTVNAALKRVGKNELRIPVFEGQISNEASQNELESILSFVEANHARYVLLALTTEKQLDLIAKIIQSPNVFPAIYIGIGGSFDMISGIYIRAPKMIQKIGLEWIWRAFQNPKALFPRYTKDFFFLLGFFFMSKLTKGDRRWRNFQNY